MYPKLSTFVFMATFIKYEMQCLGLYSFLKERRLKIRIQQRREVHGYIRTVGNANLLISSQALSTSSFITGNSLNPSLSNRQYDQVTSYSRFTGLFGICHTRSRRRASSLSSAFFASVDSFHSRCHGAFDKRPRDTFAYPTDSYPSSS